MMKKLLLILSLIFTHATSWAQCGQSAVAAGVTAFGSGITNDASCLIQAGLYAQSNGVQITAASTIAPTAAITHVTGATAINTITVPANFTSGSIVLVPDSAFTWTAAGNVSVAGTATINTPVIMTYDGTKWNPSYTSTASGSSGAMVLIQKQTLGSAAASITFSSIPGTYTNLKLTCTGTTSQGSADNLVVQFNGDTATHYQTQFISGTGSTAAASSITAGTTMYVGNLTGTSLANYPGVNDTTIFNYAGTSLYKGVTGTSTDGASTGVLTTVVTSGVWDSTAAITSLVLSTASTSNLTAGTVCNLYGIS